MKKFLIPCLLLLSMLLITPGVSAQVKIDLKGKINREANKRANQKTKEGVNKGFDKMEEGIKGILNKEDNQKDTLVSGVNEPAHQAEKVAEAENRIPPENNSPQLLWSQYDFVPGDKIIFEDNLQGEENGEFPSRWDLYAGNSENALFDGENVIMFRDGHPTIVPYLKNPEIDYLPEVFTIEFDLYLPANFFSVVFYDRKNQGAPRGATTLDIWSDKMDMRPASSKIPGGKNIANKWAHIAIACTNGKLKAYIDDTRLINIPRLEFNPTGISLHVYHASDKSLVFIKNFRIAEGGVKYYDRFLQDGRIVSNGIRFDVGRATLRPESMGVLNEIYKMLNEHPEVSVSIEGHTDSNGDSDLNQKLSYDRANTVMNQLISMGIDPARLTSKGFGESKPVAPNDTPEGRAGNRRVEFVKSN